MSARVQVGDYVEILDEDFDSHGKLLGCVAVVAYMWTGFAQLRLTTTPGHRSLRIFREEQFRKLTREIETDAALISAWKLLNEA